MDKRFKPVKTVIFDMDGTLFDTEDFYEQTFEELCRKYGKELTPEVRVKVLGCVDKECGQIIIDDLKLDCSHDKFMEDYYKILDSKCENVKMMPGAERLIRHLHAHKIPICVATSSRKDGVALKTKPHKELYKLFHHITTGDDEELKNGKPAPDIFLLAASRFDHKVDPKDCLVFEDAPNGVQGARDANMQVVMVPADHISEERKSKATLAIRSLEDFQPELFGLPPFKEKENYMQTTIIPNQVEVQRKFPERIHN